MLFTDRVVDRLPIGTHRDSRQPGLIVRVGKRSRVFRYEIAVRDGSGRRTVSQNIGRRPDVSADDARTAAAKLHAERRNGKVPPPMRAAVTLAQAADEYLNTLQGRWREEAGRFYRKHLSRWSLRTLASLSDNPEEVARWHRDVTERCGPFAANHSARVLRAIYKRRQRLDRTLPHMSPTSGVIWNPQRRADRAVPFEALPEWARRVDEIAISNPIRAAFHRLTMLTGCRPGELARLRIADVSFEKHELVIGKTKTGLDLTIPTSPEIEEQLKVAMIESAKLCAATPWVFAAISATGHLSHWREHKRGLRWTGNTGRHSYRTIAASLGCDELSIRLLQGHALSGISQGYITRQLLTGTSLREWQHRISARVMELAAIKVTF